MDFYDASSSTNLSKYTALYQNSATFTYDSTEQAYKLSKSSGGFTTWKLNNVNIKQACKLTIDVKSVITSQSNFNLQPRIGIMKDNNNGYAVARAYWADGQKLNLNSISTSADKSTLSTVNQSWSDNTWYTLELEIQNGTVTGKVYDSSGTLLNSVNTSNTLITGDTNMLVLQSYIRDGNVFIKNITYQKL